MPVKGYDSLRDAEQAHAARVDAGHATRELERVVQADEAGPVEGNFVLGDGRVGTRGAADPSGCTCHRNFGRAVERGTVLLRIDIGDSIRRHDAARIAERFVP